MASASDGHRLYVDARIERDEMQKKSDDVFDELVQITDNLIADKKEVRNVLGEKDKELENEKQLKNELHEDFIQLCHDITEIDARKTYLEFQLDEKRLQVISLSQKQKELTVICAQNERIIFEKQNALEEAQAKHTEDVTVLKMEYEDRIHAMEMELVKTKSLILEKDKELEKEKELKNELHHNFLKVCHDITEKDEHNATLASQLHDKQLQVISLSQKQKELTVICAQNLKIIFKKQNALEEVQAKHTEEVVMLKMECDYKMHAMEDIVETKAFEVEELQVNFEEFQEEMKEKRREIKTLICQRNNWKTACKQSEYGYEILRKTHEDSTRENKFLRRKIKDENEFVDERICNEDNTVELKGARTSLIKADCSCFLD